MSKDDVRFIWRAYCLDARSAAWRTPTGYVFLMKQSLQQA